jgi:hypothetical protein
MTMSLNRRSLWAAAAGLALVLVLVAVPAAADEMWVAPGDKADHEVGTWGTTNNGEARFSFAIPDDLASLTSAKVVLLGKKTTGIDWQADLSISQDGMAHDAITSSLAGSAAMTAGDIAEIDVTAAFPAALAAGVDLAGLAFQADENGDVWVVGLRIAYERTNPLAGEACADGEVLTGFDAAGDLTCVSYDDILAKLDCPAGEVFVSFDESTGSAVCTNVLANVACPAGQVLTGFDSAGAPECTGILPLLAGIGCPAGEVVQGFDSATGLPICVDTIGGGGGGGGGGGDETPSFIIDDVSFVEGNSGNTDFVFTVSLVPPDAVNTHTVDFSTSGISATSGVDFLPTSGTLTFNPGVSTQTVTVEVVGDTTVEGTEDFQVNLSSSSGPPIGDATGIGTILNDDLGDGR